jgi:hypothetical protein
MPRVDALVLPPRKPEFDATVIGGLSLVERAVLALHQAGVERIIVSTERVDGPRLVSSLAARNVAVELAAGSAAAIRPEHAAIVVTSDAIFEPAAVAALVAKAESAPGQMTIVTSALAALVAYLPPSLVDQARSFASMKTAIWSLYRQHLATRVEIGPAFCQPVPIDGHVWQVEADELRHRLGPDAFYTRPVRALSRPLTQICLRMRVPATAVTGLGIGLALLASLEIAQRGDVGLAIGVGLCVASIVLVFAGRDLERASFRESAEAGAVAARH